MKQKKRSGLSRIGALLLVFILAVNLVVPCFAAGGVVFDDTKTIDTGILTYDYDKIPKYMLEDNYALDALEYIGYDVQALKDNKVLYHQDYIGRHLASSQYLLQEDPILTYIKYSDSGAPGGSEKKAETAEEIAASQTGRVPDIDRFYNGNSTYKPGMSCTSFVEYYVFGYLKHIVGKDTKYIETMHATALQRLQDGTRTYPDTWTEMCEGKGGLISQGKVTHHSVHLDDSKEQTDKYNEIWRQISPGTIIRFGNDNSEYLHYAVYIGTYNNLHYVAHVAGGDRGPEIFIAEHMSLRNDEKTSFPIDFYDFHFQNLYGAIQVVKTGATNGTKLAGAKFIAINTTTGQDYTIGPTDENGYALVEGLPYNATSGTQYTVREIVAPEGYALDPTVHTVTISLDTPLITLAQEIVNTEEYGSLQIQKDTNTGNNKAGWQFNLYKNSPSYTTQLTTGNSGQMFRVTVSDYKGNSVTSNAVSMTTTPLKILKQPQSVKVSLGDTARFHVTVQGDGLEYKWYYQNPGGSVNEAGSTAGMYTPYYNYTISNASRSGRAMWCVITDKYGNSVTTEKAYLWLNTDPNAPATLEAAASLITYGDVDTDNAVTVAADTLAIITQPQNHVDEDGTFATFTVEAQGVGLTYVWETSTDGGKTWTRLTNPINDEPYETDSTGKYLISKLQTGNYFVQEINDGKDGWEYDLVAKPVTVTADHTATAPAKVNFTNNEITGGLLIVKTTEDKKNLVGWQFGIYTDAACENLIVTDTTRAGGRLTVTDIVPGTYWVKELGHSSGAIDDLYYCAGENPQMIVVEAGKTASVKFENKLRKGDGQIIKLTTNGGIKAGWQFHVWTDTADLGTCTTDANGEINDLNQLLPGTYYVQETGHATLTDAELAYWTLDAEVKELVIEADQIKSVTFNNQWYGQGGIVKESTGTKEGWQFHVWTEAHDYGTYTTDANGDIDLGLMDPGTVYVQEIGHATMTPEELSLWFMDKSVKELVIEAGQTRSIVIKNVPGGGFDFEKIMDDGSSAEGWQFDIQDSEGNVTTHFTDENGKIYLTLLPGTYTITEVIPADKMYEPQGGSLSFEIEIKAGEILVKTFTNKLIQGDITISKTDGKGNPVSNAGFVATGSNGTKYNFLESTTTPGLYVLTDVPIDDYIITEEVVPPGFQVSGDNKWEVSLSKDHRTETLEIVNTQLGYGKIIKDTTNGGIKEGWQFRVWTDTAELGTYTTNVNGEIDLDDLIPGIYYVQEIGHKDMTPEQLAYWIMDTEVKTLVVEAGQTKSVTFNNQWLGYGQIKKEMPDGGDLADWIFDVYRVSDNTYIGEFTSDVNGDIALGYLLPGDYRVIERVPESSLYRPVGGNEKILTVVAGEVSSITVRNTLRSGDITVNKVDGTTKAALAGAKFLLEWLDNDVWTPVVYSESIIPGGCRSEGLANGCLITGEDGTITFEGLHPDCEYRLTEVEPPAGYTLQAAPVFEGKLPADTLAFEQEVPNYSVFDLPSTGITFQLMPLFILMVSVVSLFMVMLVIAIKKGLLTEILQDIRK